MPLSPVPPFPVCIPRAQLRLKLKLYSEPEQPLSLSLSLLLLLLLLLCLWLRLFLPSLTCPDLGSDSFLGTVAVVVVKLFILAKKRFPLSLFLSCC